MFLKIQDSGVNYKNIAKMEKVILGNLSLQSEPQKHCKNWRIQFWKSQASEANRKNIAKMGNFNFGTPERTTKT